MIKKVALQLEPYCVELSFAHSGEIPVTQSDNSEDKNTSNHSTNEFERLCFEIKNNPNGNQRAQAAYLMGKSHDANYVPALCEATTDPNGNVRRLSASALGKIKDPRGVNSLVNLLQDEKSQVRQYAIKSLGNIGDPNALSYLVKMRDDPISYVQESAEVAIKKIKKSI